jgi:hypothetical protein
MTWASRTLLLLRWMLAGSALILLAVAGTQIARPAPAVFTWLISDDGYYALTIARRFGMTLRPTIDGVHLTNGFQPLWVAMLAPFAALTGGSREALVRITLALHWICFAAAAAGVAMLARRAAAFLKAPTVDAMVLALFLYLSSGTLLALHFNGLETGLLLALYALTSLWLLGVDWTAQRTPVLVGLVSGILLLARVDAVFFVAALVPAACYGRPNIGLRRFAAILVTVTSIALAVSAVWWLYNLTAFGTLMPQSGAAQADYLFPPGRVYRFLRESIPLALPLPFTWQMPGLLTAIAACLMVPAGLAAGAALVRRIARAPDDPWPRLALALVVTAALLACWYGLTSYAYWMYLRYSAPVVVLTLPIAAAMLLKPRRLRALVMALVLLAGWAEAWTVHSAPRRECLELRQFRLVDLAAETVPPQARIGALQSGALGFFRDEVVNLDGKVNVTALRRRNDLEAYVKEERIDWLVDWDVLIQRDVFRAASAPSGWRRMAAEEITACDGGTIAVYTRQ